MAKERPDDSNEFVEFDQVEPEQDPGARTCASQILKANGIKNTDDLARRLAAKSEEAAAQAAEKESSGDESVGLVNWIGSKIRSVTGRTQQSGDDERVAALSHKLIREAESMLDRMDQDEKDGKVGLDAEYKVSREDWRTIVEAVAVQNTDVLVEVFRRIRKMVPIYALETESGAVVFEELWNGVKDVDGQDDIPGWKSNFAAMTPSARKRHIESTLRLLTASGYGSQFVAPQVMNDIGSFRNLAPNELKYYREYKDLIVKNREKKAKEAAAQNHLEA